MKLLVLFLSCLVCSAQVMPSGRHIASPRPQASGGGGPSFPTISDIFARYVAEDLGAHGNGDKIASWPNSQGSAPSLVTENTSSQGYWSNNVALANGKPFVAVAASSDSYTNTLSFISQDYTVFVLAQSDGDPYYDWMWKVDGGNSGAKFLDLPTSMQYLNGQSVVATVPAISSAPVLYEFLSDTVNSYSKIYTNGVEAGTHAGPAGYGFANQFNLACTTYLNPVFEFWEFVIITHAVNSTEKTQIEAYFTDKYGKP